MTDGSNHYDALTRRRYLKGGGALLSGGLLAGCTGEDGAGDEANTADGSTTSGGSKGSNDSNGTGSGNATSAGGSSYSATMSPAGEVTFGSVPESVSVYSLLYADMAVAYGHGEAVNSLGFSTEAGGATLDAYYERLEGVSFDRQGLTQLNAGSGEISVPKELFYELDSDLHLVDPALMVSFDGWEVADIEEIKSNVAPFFGNVYSRTHSRPPEPYRGEYEYYTLWEITERVAQVFGEQARHRELAAVKQGLLARIRSNLSPKSERPEVGSIIYTDETFYPSKIDTPGFANAHVRPLGAADAFVGENVTYETTYDFETLLEIDPDVLLHRFGIASYYDVSEIRRTLESHPIGSQLSAIRNDRLYPSGNPVQGPLMNLFQLEMTVKQLYPGQFGEWPGYVDGKPYPEIPENERLFDRQRVSDIINGDL